MVTILGYYSIRSSHIYCAAYIIYNIALHYVGVGVYIYILNSSKE